MKPREAFKFIKGWWDYRKSLGFKTVSLDKDVMLFVFRNFKLYLHETGAWMVEPTTETADEVSNRKPTTKKEVSIDYTYQMPLPTNSWNAWGQYVAGTDNQEQAGDTSSDTPTPRGWTPIRPSDE